MSYYFLCQRVQNDYVIFMNVEKTMKHASSNAIPAMDLSLEIDKHLEVTFSTLHFTAVIIAPHSFYKLEGAAKNITLKRSTSTLIVVI